MSNNGKETIKQWSDPKEYLNYCLNLEKKFEVPPKVLGLKLSSQATDQNVEVGSRDIAASTAIQCYSGGIAYLKPRPESEAQDRADGTLDAGHHTTRMHMQYTWKLMVSRNVVHDFFHNNPYYNSSQQSQRYVEAKAGNYVVPAGLNEEQRNLFLESANYANEAYGEMMKMLRPVVEERLKIIYPNANWDESKNGKIMNDKAGKMSQEIARYVLPIDQFTVLDYTVNELQLLRLFRASQLPNVTDEARYTVAKMIQKVTETDPQILEELRKPVSVEWEYGINAQYVSENKEEFDAMLEGRRSKLVSFDPKSREVMAMAVRNVLGLPKSQISDEAALLKVLDPVQNPLLADVFETGIVDPLSQTAEMVNFVFADIISHAGDSQRQRHRTTPGATAPLESLFDGTMDSFVPMIVKENPELSERFLEITKKIVENVNRCIDSGMPKTAALSLLPNSQNIRLVESGNLLNRIHRMKSRLCLNAQEEIFFNDLEQARQIVEVFPETRKVLRAPCGLRKDIGEKPPCPEGKRYCGQRMWMEPIENYQLKRVL